MDFVAVVRVLNAVNVEFIVIGGFAATLHGSPRLTVDVDVLYRRTPENIRRLAAALSPHDAYLRGAPKGLPFTWDEETIRKGLNFTLSTTLGPVDVLGEVVGAGNYESLLPQTELIVIEGIDVRVASLEALIAMKRAAGRVKDRESIAELETIREEKKAKR